MSIKKLLCCWSSQEGVIHNSDYEVLRRDEQSSLQTELTVPVLPYTKPEPSPRLLTGGFGTTIMEVSDGNLWKSASLMGLSSIGNGSPDVRKQSPMDWSGAKVKLASSTFKAQPDVLKKEPSSNIANQNNDGSGLNLSMPPSLSLRKDSLILCGDTPSICPLLTSRDPMETEPSPSNISNLSKDSFTFPKLTQSIYILKRNRSDATDSTQSSGTSYFSSKETSFFSSKESLTTPGVNSPETNSIPNTENIDSYCNISTNLSSSSSDKASTSSDQPYSSNSDDLQSSGNETSVFISHLPTSRLHVRQSSKSSRLSPNDSSDCDTGKKPLYSSALETLDNSKTLGRDFSPNLTASTNSPLSTPSSLTSNSTYSFCSSLFFKNAIGSVSSNSSSNKSSLKSSFVPKNEICSEYEKEEDAMEQKIIFSNAGSSVRFIK